MKILGSPLRMKGFHMKILGVKLPNGTYIERGALIIKKVKYVQFIHKTIKFC